MVIAELLTPFFHEPFGMRITQCGLRNFLVGENFFDGVSFAQIAAQDGVETADLMFEAGALGEFYGLVNGRVWGDAVEPKNLIEAEAQQILKHRSLGASGRGFAFDEAVERGLPAHNAADEFVAKPAISGGKPGIGERNFEEIFRKFAAVQALR